MIQPLFWIILLMLIGIIKKSKRKRFLIISLSLLYFFTNEFIFMEVSRWYEYPPQTEESLRDHYSVAIVLGGMTYYNDEHQQLEFQGSSDRILNVLPFYFEGKVDKILIAGGSGRLLQDEMEAPLLRDYLVRIGVKQKDIILEANSRNTYENALFSKEIIDSLRIPPPYLLSTSASHMKRSLGCFNKVGLEVDPFPGDYNFREREFNPDRMFRPKPQTLNRWDKLIHEWVGLFFYKISGYI